MQHFTHPKPGATKAARARRLIDESLARRAQRLAEEEARRAAQPPPTLRAQFHALLWTFDDRYWRRPVAVPDGDEILVPDAHGYASPARPMVAASLAEMEERWGDGRRYPRRQALMDATLGRLEALGADLSAVLSILNDAKVDEQEALKEGHRIDVTRFLYKERDRILKRLRAALHQARKFYDRAMYVGFDPAGGIPITISPETLGPLGQLAHRLDPQHADADPLWTSAAPRPLRRGRAGRAATRARREQARAELVKAGSPKREAKDLLIAVGLAPWPAPAKRRLAKRQKRKCLRCDEVRWSTGPGDRHHARCRPKD